MTAKRISLGYRPRNCRLVRILGVRPNLGDYPSADRQDILAADCILYPTRRYARPLADAGKRVFPGPRDYHYLGDKIRQTTLFETLNLPFPKTKIYYGRQAKSATRDFGFPLVAKLPRGTGQGTGVFLIHNQTEFDDYLRQTHAAYIQEFIPIKRDLRVVAIAGRFFTAYWRVAPEGDFRTNLFQGGRVDFNNVLEDGVDFAMDVIKRCRFDDVGLDVCHHNGRWLALEANMRYGLRGVRQAGLSLPGFLDSLIEEGVI